jgi:hypothetical protein
MNTLICSPSWITLNAASATWRFVQAHRDTEARRAVAVVAVEEVAVVEVDVRTRRFRDRNRGLMDRVVVVATQHRKRP